MTNFNMKMDVNFNKEQIATNLINKSKKALLEIMIALEGHAKREAPVRTGKLRSSIHTEPKRPAERIIVSDGVNYGVFVELGTSRSVPNPFMRRAKITTEKLDMPLILKKNKLA